MSDETRAKFLAAIADRVGADRIEEIHLFPSIKQGGTESGVAVVAVRAAELSDPSVTPPHGDPLAAEIVSPDAESPPEAESREPSAGSPQEAESPEPRAARLTVYTAKYRLVLKGPERGKWEFAMQAEADAPLVTVETVVRGVQRRSGDIEDPTRLSGDELRALLAGSAS